MGALDYERLHGGEENTPFHFHYLVKCNRMQFNRSKSNRRMISFS